MCLNLFPGNVVRSGLHSSLFFTVSGMWFLLVRPACMAILTGLWQRLSSSLLWVCLSLFPVRGMASPGLGSISQCRRDLGQDLVVHLWLRGLTWRVGMRLIQVARSLLVAVSPPVSAETRRKGAWGLALQMCHSPLHPHYLHLQFFRLVCFSNFSINGEALHLTGLCLIWFGITIFSLGSPLFFKFLQFNVKAAAAHHPIIQKEVDELLAKGAVEPSSSGAGFYSSMLVVPKHTGGLQLILNLSHFNHFMHIPSF